MPFHLTARSSADARMVHVFRTADDAPSGVPGLDTDSKAPPVQFRGPDYFLRLDDKNGEALRIVGHALFTQTKANRHPALSFTGTDTDDLLLVAEGFLLSAYRFDKYLSTKTSYDPAIHLDGVDAARRERLDQMVRANFVARDLVNEPQNVLTATRLTEEVDRLSGDAGFAFEYLNKAAIEAENMGGLLAVNKGSVQPPTFNIMDWTPAEATDERTIVLVGKGVVYDTGGLSLKPTGNSMDFMKSDMAGSAAVIGAVHGIARLNLPVRVVGLVAATDNRPSGDAYAPGDVITMYDGQTVEVLNTDAEGRLTMADALHYAKRYDPDLIVDVATLTGSAARAIGPEGIVMMGTAGDDVRSALHTAGQVVHERVVEFPLWEEYDAYLKSSIADMTNLGGPFAGAITAGKFLQRFVEAPWIHLDIAGSAFLKKPKHYRGPGATGVGARLLIQFIQTLVHGA